MMARYEENKNREANVRTWLERIAEEVADDLEVRERVRVHLIRHYAPGVWAIAEKKSRDVEEERKKDRDIVRVQFPSGGRPWQYRCPGAKVGDWVIVPPTPYCQHEQFVPVVALGRDGSWSGPVKEARFSTCKTDAWDRAQSANDLYDCGYQ